MSEDITLEAIKAEFPHQAAKIDAADAAGHNLRAIYRVVSGGRSWVGHAEAAKPDAMAMNALRGTGIGASAWPTPKVLTQATPTDQKVASGWSASDSMDTARLLQAGTMSTSREAQTLVNAINHVQRDIANAYGARAQADRTLASRNRPWEAMLAPMPGMAAYQNTAILKKRIADNVADHKQTVAAIDAKIDEFRAMQKQWFAELRRHIPVGLI